jgi:peptide/nickel transport system substrate-binding protein
MTRCVALVLFALLAFALPAAAQELRIGLKAEPTSLDPQYQNFAANNQIALHIFEPLVARDAQQRLVPALALAWKPVSDTVWEFKLRPDVKFQDGSPFTADDVVFTLERAAKVPNSPTPFTAVTRQVTRVEIVDPLTLRITTGAPAPLLPVDLSNLPILSHTAAAGGAPEGRTTDELNRGEGLVGTGPFKFVAWKRGGALTLARNDSYWGTEPAWSHVVFKPLTDANARVAALVAGDVDLIEDPPNAELDKLRTDPKLALAKAVSSRVIYIGLDQHAEPSPGIPDTKGKNPLMDRRVREALSNAIDRKGIVDTIMEGLAVPAGDLLPYPAFGTSRDTRADRYDPAAAKRLLAEAGYPNGFAITLGTPNGRYLNDLKVAQAVASMWSHIGVKTGVDRAPGLLQEPRRVQIQRLPLRLGRRVGRDVQPAARAGRHAEPREGHGRHQSRPLLQSGDGCQARASAAHRRRQEARSPAAGGEPPGAGRLRHPARAVRTVGLGDAQGFHL